MSSPRSVILVLLLVASSTVAVAGNAADDELHQHLQRAQASYALGEWAEAAKEFEIAFKLSPKPALLYNAAMSHRMANNKERSLLLYTNYLRVYGRSINKDTRASVEEIIRKLEAARTSEMAATGQLPNQPIPTNSTAPPSAKAPAETTTETPEAKPVEASEPKSAPAVVVAPTSNPIVTPPPATEARPLVKRPVLWVVVGVAVVAVVVGATAGGVVASQPRSPVAQNTFRFPDDPFTF